MAVFRRPLRPQDLVELEAARLAGCKEIPFLKVTLANLLGLIGFCPKDRTSCPNWKSKWFFPEFAIYVSRKLCLRI